MGLMQRLKRWQYVYSWRLRYWWFDTDSGKRAQRAVFILSCLFCLFLLVQKTVDVYVGVTNDTVSLAIAPWVIWVIQILVSLAISYATRPRIEGAKPQEQDVPKTKDGSAAIHAFGEVWVDDSFQLAHKNLRPIPIKTKGGKK